MSRLSVAGVLLVLCTIVLAAPATPLMSVNPVPDGAVKIRFSSYSEREPAPKGRLLNVLPVRAKELIGNLARIDADEGFVFTPGETVKIHVSAAQPATIEVRGLSGGHKATFEVTGEQTLDFPLAQPGGADDFELYVVEARQGNELAARRGFLATMPTGDVRSVTDSLGTVGWEFIEWGYSPFDIASGFPGHPRNHGPLYGKLDSRLQPWNWVTDVYAPDLPKQSLRIADWSKDPFAQPYTEWARWYQYVGADLTNWRPDSWRWGEFNSGDIERLNWGQEGKRIVGRGYLSLDGKPGGIGQYENYLVANDSIFPNGTYFREWLGQIYYAATKMACEMRKGVRPRIAEADHWNDRDMGTVPMHPRLIETYLDYLHANNLPHDDLDKARSSAELADLLAKTGSPERRDHFNKWNTYQVNLRGRQYLWEAAVRAGMEVNGFSKVDWLFGNGLVGDTVQSQGLGGGVRDDYEQVIQPWAMHEFQTDWDYMHWQSGSYRFAAHSFARIDALIGRTILNPDVYNQVLPHASAQARTDRMYHEWCVPQNAAEHNRLFTLTSFMHFYDCEGKPQRVINLAYDDIYRNCWRNSVGVLAPDTPSAEAHALLDHRQASEGITMQRPIGFVGVVSSARTVQKAAGTEYQVNRDNWSWYFESLVDCGVSLPAYIDDENYGKLPADINLVFAPRKNGNGEMVIAARAGGKWITVPWKPRDRQALAAFARQIMTEAGRPITFNEMTTGFAYTFRGQRALVYVENMRSANVAEANRGLTAPPGVQEQARTAIVELELGFPARGAQVWDLTDFLPLPPAAVTAVGETRLRFAAPLRAGDGRLFTVIPAAPGSPVLAPDKGESTDAKAGKYVPWADTAYEKVAYRNAIFTGTPAPYGPKNFTQLLAPRRASDAGNIDEKELTGAAPVMQYIAPNAVVVVGQAAPRAIQQIAGRVADALRKAGGPGTVMTAEEFDAKPVSETGRYHVLAVGTVWDNEVLQRFNDPWALDRDWYYGHLGNEPAWPWMPATGFTVGWVGDFKVDDPSVGYLCVDRSSYMWEARCKAYDEKKPPQEQMPLRLLVRISGSGPVGVARAARAFCDDGLLNGCLSGATPPAGDARYTLTAERCLSRFPIAVPTRVNAGGGHMLNLLGWNQADACEYDGFLGATGVAAKRILRAKYVPEWGVTNFPASPIRACSRFELCVVECDGPAAPALVKLAGAGAKTVPLGNDATATATATATAYGTHLLAQGNTLILESAPEPWGKALLEAYLQQK